MTAPSCVDVVGYSSTGFLTSHQYNMPATVNAGELLLQTYKADAGGDMTGLDWGEFTELLNVVYDDGSTRRMMVGGKIAEGDEGGGTTTITHSATNRRAMGFILRITDWYGDLAGVEFSTVDGGQDSNPNAPAVTASWGALDNLFIWFAGWQDDGETISAYPTGYDDNQTYEDNGNPDNSAISGAVATKQATAASDNPGPATISANEAWGAVTGVVRPASTTIIPIIAGMDVAGLR